MSPAQLKKLLAKYIQDMERKKRNKLQPADAKLASKSLNPVKQASSSMLKSMITPRTAKKGGKIKKKG